MQIEKIGTGLNRRKDMIDIHLINITVILWISTDKSRYNRDDRGKSRDRYRSSERGSPLERR